MLKSDSQERSFGENFEDPSKRPTKHTRKIHPTKNRPSNIERTHKTFMNVEYLVKKSLLERIESNRSVSLALNFLRLCVCMVKCNALNMEN